jgi:hypothetical protein
MPTIQKRLVFAGAGTNDNVLAGSQYEFAPFDGTIEVAAISTAVGATLAVFSGPDVLAEPGTAVQLKATETLVYPDDYFVEDEVAQGDRLKISVTVPGAMNVNVALRITPA